MIEFDLLKSDKQNSYEINRIKHFFENNRKGNLNPYIKLTQVITIRKIKTCTFQNKLFGQKEVKALMDIP